MKKLFTVAALVLVSSFYLGAETVQALKSKICIVREVYFDETKDFCTKVSDELNRSGFPNYSTYIDEYIGKTFGSGFLYVDEKGSNYVITNRHVVSRCEGATVEFSNEDGSVSKFENLKVIATDENLDIAILAFNKNEKPFKSGITFAAKPAEDGEDVWSAGYPGLGDEPVWQFGRGNVTNARVKLKECLDPSISTLIQHSAPVDSGNSGGPLFRKSGDNYEVVGVNTWKFFYRQSTNIALPSSVIERFIADSLAEKNAFNSVQDLNSRCKSMKELFDTEDGVYFRDFSKYISYDYVKKDGLKSFIKAMNKGSTNTRSNIKGAFVNYSPIEGLKYAVSSQVYKVFAEDDFIKDAEIGEPVKNEDGTYTVSFTDKIATVETVWVYEETGLTGIWRLTGVQDVTKGKKGKKVKKTRDDGSVEVKQAFIKDFDIEEPYTAAVQWAMIANADSDKSFGNQLSLSVISKIFGIDIDYTTQKISGSSEGFFGGAITLQCPMKFNYNWLLSPYAKAGLGVSTNTDIPFLTYTQFGAKFGYRSDLALPCSVYGIAGWGSTKTKATVESGFSSDKKINFSNSGIFLGVGIGL